MDSRYHNVRKHAKILADTTQEWHDITNTRNRFTFIKFNRAMLFCKIQNLPLGLTWPIYISFFYYKIRIVNTVEDGIKVSNVTKEYHQTFISSQQNKPRTLPIAATHISLSQYRSKIRSFHCFKSSALPNTTACEEQTDQSEFRF